MTDTKKRHGCLTAWLVLVVIWNAGTIVSLALIADGPRIFERGVPGIPGWAVLTSGILCAVDGACAVALIRWKKIGFYCFCVSAVVTLFVGLVVGDRTSRDWAGVLGVLILYGLLQLGKENKGWDQLD